MRFRSMQAGVVAAGLVALSTAPALAQLVTGHHHHSHHAGMAHWSAGLNFGSTQYWGGPYLRPYSGGLVVGNGYVTGYAGPGYIGALYAPSYWNSYWGPGYYGGVGPMFPGPVISAPLVIPADAMFGPGVVQRMMGVDQPLVGAPVVAQPAVPVAPQGGGGFGVLASADPQPVVPKTRVANEPTRFRALQFVATGDEHFRKQKLNEAYQRYKDAAATAPDLAEAYFRQGLALSAMNQPALAAKAIKRALQLKPDWPESNFRLDSIYGENQLAKSAQRDALALAATERPHDGNLLFLLAVQLYFDGQAERSTLFFERAKALEVGDISAEKAFLDHLGKQRAAKAGAEKPVAAPREI